METSPDQESAAKAEDLQRVRSLAAHLVALLKEGFMFGDDPPFVDTRPDVRPWGEE